MAVVRVATVLGPGATRPPWGKLQTCLANVGGFSLLLYGENDVFRRGCIPWGDKTGAAVRNEASSWSVSR